jgi:hypothetical protein
LRRKPEIKDILQLQDSVPKDKTRATLIIQMKYGHIKTAFTLFAGKELQIKLSQYSYWKSIVSKYAM